MRRKRIVTMTLALLFGLYVFSKVDHIIARYTSPRRPAPPENPYTLLIQKYAVKYDLDWQLIYAVIYQESQFNPRAVSWKGAMGLMQLMPETARELRVVDPYQPEENIAAGVYYLRQQYDRFPESPPAHRLKLALASFNSGAGRVYDARAIAKHQGQDANQWEPVRDALTKLTSKDRHLHKTVWQSGQPKHGYFSGYRQTLAYVDGVTRHYAALQSAETNSYRITKNEHRLEF